MRVISVVKDSLRSGAGSTNPLVRWLVAFLRGARKGIAATRRFGGDASYRSVVLLRLRSRQAVHQTTPRTWVDRYPQIFSACRTFFVGREEVRILSFGCSTGEEVLTLRRYFPRAWITGAEINRRSLAICRTLAVDERIDFVQSEREAIRRRGPFDAIFCMAVLQRTPHAIESAGLRNIGDIYPFEKFDQQVSELDELLEVGGLLVIHHTQYIFSDATVASRYEPLSGGQQEIDEGPRFDRQSELVERPLLTGSIHLRRS